jgi:cell division protein ZapA
MATEPDTLSVTIFGSEYKIKGADPEYIGEVAKYVDSKMRELERRLSSAPPAKIAILTSLNIADELFRERMEKDRFVTDLKGKARTLGTALDACMRED